MRRHFALVALLVGLGGLAMGIAWRARAQGGGADAIPINRDDIAGIVTSSRGPEAGVWVIAETHDLAVKNFIKIVVTDSQGRYLLPQLPQANYSVWVRGYGLVDSPKVRARPGVHLDLHAVIAPSASAAAQYYPADYWYSLLKPPPKSDFPGKGTGPQGNGIARDMRSQDQWLYNYKMSCNVCHQLGDKATRVIEPQLGEFPSSVAAWAHRVLVGQDGAGMAAAFDRPGRQVALQTFANWTDRIAAGALPPAPPRPQGVERNVVITEWSWGEPNSFVHSLDTTNKLDPTVNANGPVYGVDWGNDALVILHPRLNLFTQTQVPNLFPETTPFGKQQTEPFPSPYWGKTLYWHDLSIPNDAALDREGRVWMSGRSRPPADQPAYCLTMMPWARLSPYKLNFRGVEYYNPHTARFHTVNTCFDTHHVRFAGDKDETLYGNGPFDGGFGWINTHLYEKTRNLDDPKVQGWCQPWYDFHHIGIHGGHIDPAVDRKVKVAGVYAVQPSPDGTVWITSPGPFPGKIIRIDPRTCVSEPFEPPFDNPASTLNGFGPRGIDQDSNGVIWTGLAGSGQLASFDVRKCKHRYDPDLKDPTQQCPEGWTLYPVPGPTFEGTHVKVDFLYYNFVDRFDTLGLGKDVPMANGTNSDSVLALMPNDKWVVLRDPYPMGFYARYLDGRIDNPNTGWKGRGLWATYGPNAPWHEEGGLGQSSYAVKFQVRPSPLAR